MKTKIRHYKYLTPEYVMEGGNHLSLDYYVTYTSPTFESPLNVQNKNFIMHSLDRGINVQVVIVFDILDDDGNVIGVSGCVGSSKLLDEFTDNI